MVAYQESDKVEQTYAIAEQVLNDLSDEAIYELLGGYQSDIDKVYDEILNQTYQVLFGNQIKINSLNHVEKVSNSLKETLRKDNFLFFILDVLPEFTVNNHHIEWAELIQNYKKVGLIASRGLGKSYFSYAYMAWKLYRYEKASKTAHVDRTLSKKGILVSSTTSQVKERMGELKELIENNATLRELLYPEDNLKLKWQKEEIICKNGATVKAFSYESAKRGSHPGWIVFDDILKDEILFNISLRRNNIKTFNSVFIPMADHPLCQLVAIGTPMHQNDIFGYLKTVDGWHIREYPSIFPDGSLVWEEKQNKAFLRDKQNTQGSILFGQEYLCRVITSGMSIFPRHILQKSIEGMEDYSFIKRRENTKGFEFEEIFCTVDLNHSQNINSDYFVCATFGLTKARNADERQLVLLDIVKGQGLTDLDQLSYIEEINKNMRPSLFVIESNSGQSYFIQQVERKGISVKSFRTTQNKHHLTEGLPYIRTLIETNRLKMPFGNAVTKEAVNDLFDELEGMTYSEKGIVSTTEHDDVAMALYFAANYHLRGEEDSVSFGFLSLD